MQYLNKILIILIVVLSAQYATAQPPARKKAAEAEKKNTLTSVPLSDRAKAQYPKTELPNEVVWKRDLYRVIDLKKEKNASLYYPIEPMGESVNLITSIFRLLLENKIHAYNYNLDGNESFAPENIIPIKDILQKYRIYFQEDKGVLSVASNDIPSAEVLSYFIKESNYFDSKTSTYGLRVVAICPVLHRAGSDFTARVESYPMFWLSFDELAPYLAQQTVMSSSFNNVTSTTLSDYFLKNSYEGEIYKTVNLRNVALEQYCKDDAALKKERADIEKQISDFKDNLWKVKETPVDSAALQASDNQNSKDEASATKVEKAKPVAASKSAKTSVKAKKSSSSKSGSSSPRVSVRRTRR